MADTPINDAAEKAYAAASEKAAVAKPVVAPAPVKAEAPVVAAAPAVAAPAPAKVEAPVVAKAAPAPVKPAPTKLAVKRVAKPVAKKAKPAVKVKAAAKTAAKPVVALKVKPVRKTVAKIAPKVLGPVSKPVPTTTLISKLKDSTMATTVKKTTEDFSSKIQGAMKDAQDRAKTAFEKSQAAMGDANEFSKGNLEALVETGKVLASGIQSMGKSYVAEVKSAVETIQADAKELTSVKSPKEFVELQSKLIRKYFDGVVAYNSKNAEAALKLANEAFQPISSRVSLAVEKVRKAA